MKTFLISTLDGSGQLHAPAALPTGERAPLYTLDRRLGGPQSRSGRRGEEKNLSSAGIRIPAVQPVARRYRILKTRVKNI
jgi:hypothetical protein